MGRRGYSETDPIVFRTHFLALAEHLDDHVHIYTDGSKDGDRTACAVVTPSFEFSKRLPDRSSIFSAELQALVSALRYCKINISPSLQFFVIPSLCYKHCLPNGITHMWLQF